MADRQIGWDGTEGMVGYAGFEDLAPYEEGLLTGVDFDATAEQARLAAAAPADAAPDRLTAVRDGIDAVLAEMGVTVEDRPRASELPGNRIALGGAVAAFNLRRERNI